MDDDPNISPPNTQKQAKEKHAFDIERAREIKKMEATVTELRHSYLLKLGEIYPTWTHHLLELQQLHTSKLWHQLHNKVEKVLSLPEIANDGESQLRFYEHFVQDFEMKLNLLRLAIMIVKIAHNLEPDRGIVLLESVRSKVEKKDNEAHIICKIELVSFRMRIANTEEQNREIKSELEEYRRILDEDMPIVSNVVNSAFYHAQSEYFRMSNMPGEYYKTALLYLAYTPQEEIPLAEQQRIAFDLGIAALLGQTVYNFGELLSHPALKTLQGTQAEWLFEVLHVFNRGAIEEYEVLIQKYQHELQSQPGLVAQATFLKQKIQLMSLMELVFSRPVGDRIVGFEVVAKQTKQSVETVELLLLKGLALGLIKGVIDEVAQEIHVSWVQPRVLDRQQIAILRDKVAGWVEKGHQTLLFVESQTPELFA